MSRSSPEIVIIGAGAAGIGAARELMRLNVPFIVLEAKDRVGGRAYSETESLGHLWDHGCHWFHSANLNPLRAIAEEIGHLFQKQPRPFNANVFIDGAWEARPIRQTYVWPALENIVRAGASRDVAAADLLDRGHAWYPMVRHWIQLMYSADPEAVSTRDAANYHDTGINLAVEGGYGALIAGLSDGLPIALNTPVLRLAAKPGGIEIGLSDSTLVAKAVVLAVPARQLESGRLTIMPQLPASIAQAFADVPMGWYEKIGFAFDRRVFEHMEPPYADIFDPVAPQMRPLNFELHPFSRPIAVAHVAGSFARDLADEGDAALIDFAVAQLKRAFGTEIEKRITRRTATRWTCDPWIGGAYSCAKPGRAGARRAFLEPVHERIFLAGEHTHQSFFATAHGAYMSGQDAARRAAALLSDLPAATA